MIRPQQTTRFTAFLRPQGGKVEEVRSLLIGCNTERMEAEKMMMVNCVSTVVGAEVLWM